jgi:small acid-soluble spore protein O (minor)
VLLLFLFCAHYDNGGEKIMGRNKANHIRPGMNAAKAQGKGAGYETEFGNEALTLPNEKLSEAERQNNKKTKKRH